MNYSHSTEIIRSKYCEGSEYVEYEFKTMQLVNQKTKYSSFYHIVATKLSTSFFKWSIGSIMRLQKECPAMIRAKYALCTASNFVSCVETYGKLAWYISQL